MGIPKEGGGVMTEGNGMSQEHCYRLSVTHGALDCLKDRITDSEWAFHWARYIGDREIMDALDARGLLEMVLQ